MIKGAISIKSYFRWTTWTSAFLSIIMAWISDVFSTEAKVAIPILLSGVVYIELKRHTETLKRFFSMLCWIGIIWSVVQVVWTRDVVLLGHALLFLLLSNAINLDKKGRFITVMGSSLLLCFSGLVLDPGVISYLVFLVFLFVSTSALNSANFYLNLQRVSDRRLILDASYFLQLAKTAPIGILIALAVFALFPRINQLYMDMPFAIKQRYKIGYNGEINLGDQGEIEQDDAVVLSVSSFRTDWLEKRAMDLYLKGGSLDSFDGVRWSKSSENFEPYQLFQSLQDNRLLDRQKGLVLDIITNPFRTRTIFLPDGRFSIRRMSRSIGRIYLEPYEGSLVREDDSPQRYQYSVQTFQKSKIPSHRVATLRSMVNKGSTSSDDKFQLSEDQLELLLHIPGGLEKGQIFQSWKNEIGLSSNDTIPETFKAIRNFFRKNYRSTLINSYSGKSGLESFLSDERYGHCEYFSTASVMLLRSLGVPARIATGYRGGDYNRVAEAVIVRQLHAHAWVEFFVPGIGWNLFDPTPPISEQFSQSTLHFATRYIHAANFWLSKYLVDYNLLTQRKILGQFRRNLPLGSSGGVSLKGIGKYLGIIVVLLIAIYLAWLNYRRYKRDNKPVYIRAFHRYLTRKGSQLTRPTHQTYRSFIKDLKKEGLVDSQILDDFVDLVEKDLYGPLDSFQHRDDEVRIFLNRISDS